MELVHSQKDGKFGINDVYPEILTILSAVTGKNPEMILPETKLVDELEMDSLQLMNVLEKIEDSMGVDIPINFIADMSTVNDMVDAIVHQLNLNLLY